MIQPHHKNCCIAWPAYIVNDQPGTHKPFMRQFIAGLGLAGTPAATLLTQFAEFHLMFALC
jgi:hypothetical protein